MIPHTLRFVVTVDIDNKRYNDLLKTGYKDYEIIGFMKANCRKAIDFTRIDMPLKDITIESDDDYTIIKKPIPMKYSGFEGESNNVRTIKPTEEVRTEYSRNEAKLSTGKREW